MANNNADERWTSGSRTYWVERSLNGWRARWNNAGEANNHWLTRDGRWLVGAAATAEWAAGLFATKADALSATRRSMGVRGNPRAKANPRPRSPTWFLLGVEEGAVAYSSGQHGQWTLLSKDGKRAITDADAPPGKLCRLVGTYSRHEGFQASRELAATSSRAALHWVTTAPKRKARAKRNPGDNVAKARADYEAALDRGIDAYGAKASAAKRSEIAKEIARTKDILHRALGIKRNPSIGDFFSAGRRAVATGAASVAQSAQTAIESARKAAESEAERRREPTIAEAIRVIAKAHKMKVNPRGKVLTRARDASHFKARMATLTGQKRKRNPARRPGYQTERHLNEPTVLRDARGHGHYAPDYHLRQAAGYRAAARVGGNHPYVTIHDREMVRDSLQSARKHRASGVGAQLAELERAARSNPRKIQVGDRVYDEYGNPGTVEEVPKSRGGSYWVRMDGTRGKPNSAGIVFLLRSEIRTSKGR